MNLFTCWVVLCLICALLVPYALAFQPALSIARGAGAGGRLHSGLVPKNPFQVGVVGRRLRLRLSSTPAVGGGGAEGAGAGGDNKNNKAKKVKDDIIQVTGKVVESLPNATFRVEIEPSKQVVLATVSGKIRKNFVRIIVGDSVNLDLSTYDLSRGRITFRNK
eukprot:gene3379-3704_t